MRTKDIHLTPSWSVKITLARRGTVLGAAMCPSWPQLLLPQEKTCSRNHSRDSYLHT